MRGTYRGYDIISMPPISSGGVALIEMLNILEGYDLAANGYGSAQNAHLITEAMRRAYADRARFVGDPDFNPDMPVAKLISKEHAAELRKTITSGQELEVDARPASSGRRRATRRRTTRWWTARRTRCR